MTGEDSVAFSSDSTKTPGALSPDVAGRALRRCAWRGTSEFPSTSWAARCATSSSAGPGRRRPRRGGKGDAFASRSRVARRSADAAPPVRNGGDRPAERRAPRRGDPRGRGLRAAGRLPRVPSRSDRGGPAAPGLHRSTRWRYEIALARRPAGSSTLRRPRRPGPEARAASPSRSAFDYAPAPSGRVRYANRLALRSRETHAGGFARPRTPAPRTRSRQIVSGGKSLCSSRRAGAPRRSAGW